MQAERAANGQHPVAHLHAIGIAQFRRRQIPTGVNLYNRQIRVLIDAHNLRRIFLGFVIQLHLNLGGLIHHVIVGQNISALVHDDARAQAAFRLGRRILPALSLEKAVKEILHRIVVLIVIRRGMPPAAQGGLAVHHLGGGNIHDRRLDTVHNSGK